MSSLLAKAIVASAPDGTLIGSTSVSVASRSSVLPVQYDCEPLFANRLESLQPPGNASVVP